MLVLFFLVVATTADAPKKAPAGKPDRYYTGCIKRQACEAEAKDENEVFTVQCMTFSEPDADDLPNYMQNKFWNGKKTRQKTVWISSQCDFKATRTEAAKACSKIGGRLPLVAEQQNNILKRAQSSCADDERVWLISKFDENINGIREWMKDKKFAKMIKRRWGAKRCWKFSAQFLEHNDNCKAKRGPCFKAKRKCVKAVNKQTKNKKERQKLKVPCRKEFRKCKLQCINDNIPHMTKLEFQCDDEDMKRWKRRVCNKCDQIQGEKLKLDCGDAFCSKMVMNNCVNTEAETALLGAADDDIKKFCFYSNKRVQLTENIWASQTICSDLPDNCENIDTEACVNWEDYKTKVSRMKRKKAKLCPACGVCISEKKAKVAVRAQKPHAEFKPLKDQRRMLDADYFDDLDDFEDADDEFADELEEERNLESAQCSTQKDTIMFPGCYCMFECVDEDNIQSECATRDNINKLCCEQWAMKDEDMDWWSCSQRFSWYPDRWWTHPIYAEAYDTADDWDAAAPLQSGSDLADAREATLNHYLAALQGAAGPVEVDDMMPRKI